MIGKVVAVNISQQTGVRKTNVGRARVLKNFGLEGDAHAGSWHRQVSLLAQESIDKMRSLGLAISPGDFAENITTSGIDLLSLKEPKLEWEMPYLKLPRREKSAIRAAKLGN